MVNTLLKHLKIHQTFAKQFFKTLLEYRLDFIIGMLSFLLTQFSGLFFLYLIFNQIPILDGWTIDELILIYGIFQLPRGLDHLLTDPIWWIPNYVKNGDLDRYLLRPINPLFQIVSQKVDHNALGELLLGIVILVYIIPKLAIEITLINTIVLIIYIIFGSIIYTSIKLFFATIAFFTKESFPIMVSAYDMSTYGKYPVTIFPKVIQLLIQYVFPFAFTAYYPAIYLLGKDISIFPLLKTIIVSLCTFFIAYRFWLFGLSKYESAGN